MSNAGIYSNRGDGYQTLVAFDWALTVLTDPDFQWIEVDSTAYSVDDVVIGKTDGTMICCQCKKNQTDFKAWTISDLADELDKGFGLLELNKQTEVRFYSRSPFGELAKLREHSTTQADEASYCASLGKELQKVDAALAKRLATHASNLSTYDFLRHTKFESSNELDRMMTLLQERLRYMASNSRVAFDALWTRLDQLGGRMEGGSVTTSTQYRLTKEDIKAVLHHAGAMLVPIMIIAEVRASFASTSSIGRSWHRDIAGELIPSPTVNELLAAIDARKRSILLTGLPGSGKTCVMLDLQQALEQRAQTRTDMVPLFIQSREFADLATAQERQAQGLSEQWVEKAARMAEDAQVVVVIDSLDVLSIAREHRVLTYFLAQIDRLLLIPNITVVTACRDFDRHYDRRIAERQWDVELKCQPLNWDAEIAPLFIKLGIDTTSIDTVTRELIRNPRELALFVDLAQREGSFNVVTSQALAQRYLDTIVRADAALGETAMQAIEAIANEMLKSRSLAVPYQRFVASQDVLRLLRSLHVLQKTHDGKLTFGHQTLLDVLVISGAVRSGDTLNEFIQRLPPVPFVRPSIRSFVAQLATGERREFRKQLRTVLTGSAAFHIRRLVAESLSEQIPMDDDWALIRDLRDKHREVFQVIYSQAGLIEWHHFWVRNLLPLLNDTRDAEGLTAHVHRVAQWKNEDAAGVLAFWMEVLSLNLLDGNRVAEQLGFYLSEFKSENLSLVTPFLEKLLSMPRSEHSFLGCAVARCVKAGALKDAWLWRYIAGDISNDDMIRYRFDNKLHCQSHEFGNNNDNFLLQRMEQSSTLLNLAMESIEQWSQIKSSRYGNTSIGYRSEFLDVTSYDDAHTQTDHRHIDSERILLDAMEAAILNHAKTHSDWWQSNRERLSFNLEGALRYFAIRACTTFPELNIDLIGRILRDKKLLESDLSYELATLIQTAFIYLDEPAQNAVLSTILTIREDDLSDESYRPWILKARAEFISTIPCHLRSSEAQALLDTYETASGALVRQPSIGMRGGIVSAPFTFEIFLNASDDGVMRLLAHYSGYKSNYGDFLVGGSGEVGGQLREAASRHPLRFLQLLSTYRSGIPDRFRDDIMDGAANYLAHRYGNLQANGTWIPLEEPDAHALVKHILNELEKHPSHWQLNRSASKALEACAHVIDDTQNAERLVFLAIGFANLREESTIRGDSVDLLTTGINMMSGNVSDALMIVANKLQEQDIPLPELLVPTLRRFAGNEHPAIRALILRRLAYLQSMNSELGWDLFQLAMQDATGLWQYAEPCLYYAYHNNFEKVSPLLARIYSEGSGKDLEMWGRISALAALTKQIDSAVWLEELKTLDATDAWRGAASVWTNSENIKRYRDQCLAGITVGLSASYSHAMALAQQLDHVFRDNSPPISIPIELICLCFTVFESDTDNNNKYRRLYCFDEWLNATSHRDPEHALAATEIYLAYVNHTQAHLFQHKNTLTQLITRLFAEAEEREESDHGAMLQRVVSVQDTLLSLGVNGIDDWLKAAERQ
ncbi:MAG: ATP-binding protein [Candidatus Pacebacteria bacterium]|nr:ATP-binding protein [Candidatus Paceibacterota bacterium]